MTHREEMQVVWYCLGGVGLVLAVLPFLVGFELPAGGIDLALGAVFMVIAAVRLRAGKNSMRRNSA